MIAEKIHTFGGRVEELSPAMAVGIFGLDPVEDAPCRAAHAALAIQTVAERARGGEITPPTLRMTIGVDEVLVAQTDRGTLIDAGAKRNVLDALSGLAESAAPDSILVGEAAARFLERRFELMPAGRGMYQLLRRERPGFVRTRFVGRVAELTVIRQALERIRTGHGHVVAVVGDPGVGKSRLVWEATHTADMLDCRLLETQAIPYSGTSPYFPVSSLLRTYFKIDDRDDLSAIRGKVIRGLGALDSTLAARLRSPLLALLDVAVDDEEWKTADPPLQRQWTLEACTLLLTREGQVQPLVLVWEDLHWIDSETQAVLDRLVDTLPTARILLLAVYRPEYRHTWSTKTYYSQVPVDPLPPESADELVKMMLGDGPDLEQLRRLLIERTEGNPFFVEESVRTLLETGAMVGERRAYRLIRPIDEVRVPTTVQAVLAARIDRLPPEQKGLLQAAAVIGKDIPLALLQAIADQPETVSRLLTGLEAAEFLYRRVVFPELEYTFKHTLTHEVAYGSMLHERRRALHARITESIEKLYSDRLAEQVERLAHHALRGEVWEKALSCLRQAGAKALARSAYREARGSFEQALVALRHLPESRATVEQAIDLRFDLRNSLYPLADLGRILDYLREAETLAKALDDQRRLGKVTEYMSHYFWWIGDPHRAVESGQRALALAATLKDLGLQVAATVYLGRAYVTMGDYRRASDIFRRNVELLQGDLIRERLGMSGLPAVASRAYSVWCLAELGEFARGIVIGEEGVRIANSVDHPLSIVLAYFGVGRLYLSKGDLHTAIPVLERALGLSRMGDIPIWFPLTASALGSAYTLSGRIAEAQSLLEQAVEQAVSRGIMATHSLQIACLGEAHLLAGHIDDAIELAERALNLTRQHEERGHEAWALRLLGEIGSHRDPPEVEKAEGHYRQAMALAEPRGMRPLVAHCHLGLGKLHRQMGKSREAHEHLTTASTMYREMDMRFWLEKAEGEMKEQV